MTPSVNQSGSGTEYDSEPEKMVRKNDLTLRALIRGIRDRARAYAAAEAARAEPRREVIAQRDAKARELQEQ